MTIRVTHVYRRENGEWKIVHRHGDTAPLDESPPKQGRDGLTCSVTRPPRGQFPTFHTPFGSLGIESSPNLAV